MNKCKIASDKKKFKVVQGNEKNRYPKIKIAS